MKRLMWPESLLSNMLTKIRRAAEILLVLEGIYGSEGIPDANDPEQVRFDPPRFQDAIRGARRNVCGVQKNPNNGQMVHRPRACKELEEVTA